MLRLLSRTALTLILCGALGGHWAALQSFAWAKMLVENSRSASLATAISKTFDGQHPCSLCLAVEKGNCQEKKSSAQISPGKIDLICATRSLALRPDFQLICYPERAVCAALLGESPPAPPPRLA